MLRLKISEKYHQTVDLCSQVPPLAENEGGTFRSQTCQHTLSSWSHQNSRFWHLQVDRKLGDQNLANFTWDWHLLVLASLGF